MLIVIGNGTSKTISDVNLFKNHTTYGCDYIHKRFFPDNLISENIQILVELVTNGYTKEHICHFRNFTLIPSFHYDTMKQSTDKRMKIAENEPTTENFIQFAHEGVMYFLWIDSNDLTKNIDWWSNEYDDWITETVSLRTSCLENPNETLYCVGYDYFHNQTSSGVYLGSSTNVSDSESQDWIGQHRKIEEEFPNCEFVFVGKDIDYPEFEKMLHK
jgi:hypothetical protein